MHLIITLKKRAVTLDKHFVENNIDTKILQTWLSKN